MMWKRGKKTLVEGARAKQSIFRLFKFTEKAESLPYALSGSEKANTMISFDPQMWKLAEIALLDAERRKAQAYTTRLHDSVR